MLPALLAFRGQPSTAVNALISAQQAVVVGVFYWLPVATAYILKKAKHSRKHAAIVLAFLLTYFVPLRKWQGFQRSKFWDHFLHYFQVTVRGVSPPTATAAPRGTLLAVVPHGIVPYSLGLMAFGSLGEYLRWPKMVTASIIKHVPIFGRVLYWGGGVEATKEEISQVFTSFAAAGAAVAAASATTAVTGSTSPPVVAITPGGIGEMYLGYPQPGFSPMEEIALLEGRQGFVRLALQAGATLVPVFCFGASGLFHRVVLPSFIERLSRYLRASLLLFYGRLGLPVPFEVPITYAFGRHIALQVSSLPRPEEVDFIHNTFKRELLRAFNAHKAAHGWAHKELRIV